jgi:hypothetical protein
MAIDPVGPGLDLLVLFDRSESMSATSLRHVDRLLLELALNDVAWNGSSTRLNHRFGVVTFGSRPRVEIPLSSVRPVDLARLRGTLSRIALSSMLGKTDFVSAFDTAARAFASLPPEEGRRRAILVVTDGEPDVPGVRMSGARAVRDIVSARLAASRISMEVLILGVPGSEPSFWRDLPSTRLHQLAGGLADMLADAHLVVTDLLSTRVAGSASPGSSESLVLPPYLEFVVFDIFRGHGAKDVAIFAPGSAQQVDHHVGGVEEIRIGDVLSTIVVRSPKPGVWTFRKRDRRGRVKILSQQFFPRGELVEPSIAGAVRQHDLVSVAYRLVDGEARALKELAGYPLSVHLSLIGPDASRVTMPMNREAGPVPASFRAAFPALCPLGGRYRTEVQVAASDASGRSVTVFEDRWSGFTVGPRDAPTDRAARTHAVSSAKADAGETSPVPLWFVLPSALVIALVAYRAGRR